MHTVAWQGDLVPLTTIKGGRDTAGGHHPIPQEQNCTVMNTINPVGLLLQSEVVKFHATAAIPRSATYNNPLINIYYLVLFYVIVLMCIGFIILSFIEVITKKTYRNFTLRLFPSLDLIFHHHALHPTQP